MERLKAIRIIHRIIKKFLNAKKTDPEKLIKYYYNKYLKCQGVKEINKTSMYFHALTFLYLNIKQEINILDLKSYVTSKGITLNGGDSLQIRHLGQQFGYNIVKGGEFFNGVKLKKSNYLLQNLKTTFKGFIKDKRSTNITPELWTEIKKEYEFKCVNCGSQEGTNMRWNKNKITVLTQGHMNPLKELKSDNVIPQCEICNNQYKNKAIFNKRGFVIKFKETGF